MNWSVAICDRGSLVMRTVLYLQHSVSNEMQRSWAKAQHGRSTGSAGTQVTENNEKLWQLQIKSFESAVIISRDVMMMIARDDEQRLRR